MTNPTAVLVEDDPEQSEFSRRVLEGAGYFVLEFNSIAPARDFLDTTDQRIDLFVLDRRLPVNAGETAADELGDELMRQVRTEHPDSRLIVFTGFATVSHVQESLAGSGQLPAQDEEPIDRVTVLEKHQSLEFKAHIEEYRRLLQRLTDIEIISSDAVPLGDRDRRALRRLAFEYRAVSVLVQSLAGGLTGVSVWRCQLYQSERPIATVVVKRVKARPSPGGLSELLPRSATTVTFRTLSGLMDGGYLSVLQLAGDAPRALMQVIGEAPEIALQLARPVLDALHSVPQRSARLAIGDACSSLVSWEDLTTLLAQFGVAVPSGSLTASINLGARHGDLHPGNILVDEGVAVLIDFDSETFGAGALDPVTLMISTLVHPDSPIRGERWPTEREIEDSFGTHDFGIGHPCEAWFIGVQRWLDQCRLSDRELWALTLAYAGRQLKFRDVLEDNPTLGRVIAIARRASAMLEVS